MVVLPKEINEILKEPEKSFEQEPLSILKLIVFASEVGYDFDASIYDKAASKIKALNRVSTEELRSHFEKIVASKNAAKGLTILSGIGAMDCILGTAPGDKISKREMNDFLIYAENIDQTKQTRLRRLALFYRCFEEKRAIKAVERLEYEEEDKLFLFDGIYLLDRLHFITNKYEFKKFLVKYGMERYEFLHNLSKAQRIVYDLPVNRIESRHVLIDNIKEWNEPIFVTDLAVNAEDLVQEGISLNGEQAEKILEMLVDIVHMKPKLNTRKDMLEYARKFSKNKISAAFRKVRFLR